MDPEQIGPGAVLDPRVTSVDRPRGALTMSSMLDAAELIRRYAAAVEELFYREFPDAPGDFLTEGARYQFSTGGKRLRPALCLMTCELMGGSVGEALPFALATEMLHNFFLIHDDIEDGDRVRRDQETLWAKLGVPDALNVSDFLIARAYRLMLESSLPGEIKLRLARVFSYAFQKTVEGQALDINLRASPKVNLDTYFRIVQLKTAYYLALTWVGGAIVAGARDDALEAFWDLGQCLGPAFQIRDDIIDLTDGKGRGGEIGCDIREGKPSIFFAYVLDHEKGTAAERQKLIEIMGRPRESTDRESVLWAIEFYRREGALDFAQSEATKLAAEASRVLERSPLDEKGKEQFREMARFIIGRRI